MEEWDKENGDVKWLNKGIGIAQLLMIISEKNAELYDGPDQEGNQYHLFDFFMNGPEVCIYDLTEREQRIIATIIQWLGTNVGFSFLRRCFQRAGYMIKEVPNPSSKPVKPLGLKGRFRILRET
ncbi:MAG: hypothetical protein IMZ64_13165 [Bacteroidetes bacterium]|nr:hypothetical protein [Bacteroidota bacterium]